jgi:CHAT domain-containing protein/tetratricopeptide (TPR) repeat protein
VIPPATPDLNRLLALALSRPYDALATARALLSDGAPDDVAAVAHQAAAIVLRDFGDIEEALTEFRAALRSARRSGDHERLADAQAAYGLALVMAGRPGAGLARIEDAIQGAVGPTAGRLQLRKAHALWLLGRNAEYLRASQRAVSLLSGSGDLVWEARALSHRATAHLALGAVARADVDYLQAEALYAQTDQVLEYASARHDRGATAFARGDLPAALALLDDAQRLVDQLEVFEPDLFVTRVQVLLAAELHVEARRVALDGVARSVHVRGSATRRAELLLSAAMAAGAAGDAGAAAEHSAQALRMFRHQDRTWWAARAQLVLLESRFKSGDRSVGLQRQASRLAAVLDSVDAAHGVDAHLLAGRVAMARDRAAAGARHLRAAAAHRPRDIRARATGWLARAVLADAEGRHRDMLRACGRGLDMVDTYLGTLGATEMRAQATARGGELARLALAHSVRTGRPERLLFWSERWRATTLTAQPLHRHTDPELTRDLAALRTLARRLREGPSAGVPGLLREQRRLEEAIRRRAMHRPGTGNRQTAPVRTAELQEVLGETDLVELTDVEGQLFAVVVSGDRAPSLHRVGDTAVAERALAHLLFALRRESSRRGQAPLDLQQIGTRLQHALLGPVVEALRHPSVVLVPTGSLHAVPWALLPGLEGRAVTVAPSATTWVRARRSGPAVDRRVVLVGGPHLSTGATEVRRLAERYPEAILLVDGKATSEQVLAAMDGAWLVHVAAHGTFRADSPLLSALELDDGPLTVYDLERLGQAPRRVVLSSCNSAVGAPSGADELLGVVSALMTLGSVGVVASVVPVDDPGTVPFMVALHGLLSELPLGEALAAAARSVGDDPGARTAAKSFIALGV